MSELLRIAFVDDFWCEESSINVVSNPRYALRKGVGE